MKEWRQSTDTKLPPGVARAWHAVEGGLSWAGVFETMAGGQFILVYHVLGDPKATAEKFPSFQMAQEHANRVLSENKVVPRTFV